MGSLAGTLAGALAGLFDPSILVPASGASGGGIPPVIGKTPSQDQTSTDQTGGETTTPPALEPGSGTPALGSGGGTPALNPGDLPIGELLP